MSEIRTSGPLLFTEPDCPTRVGEIINTLSEIYDIPMPRLGMSVYVKDEGVNYTITKLESKLIDGVLVPNAKVAGYELQTGKSIAWNSSSNVNDYVVAGVYNIAGERLNVNDGLPIANSDPGHTISARLVVLDSSITGTGDSQDKCITQVLTLSNRTGEDGNMYIRTGHGGNINSLSWEPWATLQTNINVDTVDNLDNLKDNGIYSGVWTKGSYKSYPLTFVCVVINDYFVGIAPRRISQFVYGLSKFDGTVVYQFRVWDDSKNAWGDWEILNKDAISSMISNEIKKVTDGVDPEKLDSLKDLIAWVDTHGGEVAEIKSDIQANTEKVNASIKNIDVNPNVDDVELDLEDNAERMFHVVFPEATTERAGVMTAEDKKEQVKKTPLLNGDIVVGQAREVYSRTGKVDSATFLKRTTAGGTSISDGVASVKQIGGNIVKNLGGELMPNVATDATVEETIAGIYTITVLREAQIPIKHEYTGMLRVGHHYYTAFNLKASTGGLLGFTIGGGFDSSRFQIFDNESIPNEWCRISGVMVYNPADGVDRGYNTIFPFGTDRVSANNTANITRPIFIDLTEMFGAGNEPTKEECDRMFSTLDALPQGLTVAQPTGLKSVGYNQWNPANVLLNKSIVENAIEDDVADRHIAIVECLPCKIGIGENNGYIIGYGEGDSWSVEGIEVYFSPLNPMDYIGQDVDLYMHMLETDSDYSTYVPQCKGYLLIVTPTIDKLCVHFRWSGDREFTDYEEYVESNVVLPTIPEMSEWGLAGISTSGTTVQDTIDLENMVYTKRLTKRKLNNELWTYYPANDTYPYGFFVTTIKGIKLSNIRNVFPSSKYTPGTNFKVDKVVFGNIGSDSNTIYIIDSEFNDRAALNANLADVDFYLEIAPEEYPIVTKTAPNYIGSDYGVEEFTGSKIPLAANILFYMRSLVSETRNFLDRLMARLGTSDATAVADKIADAIIPATETTEVEPTEVVEE